MRKPDAYLPTLERRVVITGPPELIQLSTMVDLQILDELVSLLKEPDRAWAAEVLLASMTQNEEDIVNSFSSIANEWWDSLGKTSYRRWGKWLEENKEKLTWDPTKKVFVTSTK